MNIRLLTETDSMEQLTLLIRKAYKQLADMGFRYWGTHQSVDDTQKRVSGGECYVMEKDGELVATILLSSRLLSPEGQEPGHPWYGRDGVATFHQFAVAPGFQKQGVGGAMMEFIEERAKRLGYSELACDTAEGASHLVKMYKKRGFRQTGTADWPGTNYISVILSKSLQ
jgi:GNAT superfamily N-acetyltransferase